MSDCPSVRLGTARRLPLAVLFRFLLHRERGRVRIKAADRTDTSCARIGHATPHLRNGPDPHDAWDLSSRVSLVGDRTMWGLAERGYFGGLNYGVAQRAAVPFRFRVGGSGGEPFSRSPSAPRTDRL